MYFKLNNLDNTIDSGDIVSIPNAITKGIVSYFIVAELSIQKNNLNSVYVLISLETGNIFDIRQHTNDYSYHTIEKSYNREDIVRFVECMGGTVYKGYRAILELY